MLTDIDTVLYATDLGIDAKEAFRMAASVAVKFDAALVVVHAVEPVPEAVEREMELHLADGQTVAALRESRRDDLHKSIDTRISAFCAEELPDGAGAKQREPERRIAEGPAAQTILDVADEVDADLLVLGNHMHSAIGDVFLGSVANKVMHQSKRPVLLVPVIEQRGGE